MEKRYLTIEEAAELLQMSVKYLRNILSPSSKIGLTVNGHVIKPIRINRQIRIDRQKIEECMQQKKCMQQN
ncbi:MAG: helix-turn-helix domain-containing protein [bacterium]